MSTVKDFVELKEKDQLKLGDKLVIIGKGFSDSQVSKVHDIINVGGNEEIIISDEDNRYFITDMYLKGESWADDIFIIKE